MAYVAYLKIKSDWLKDCEIWSKIKVDNAKVKDISNNNNQSTINKLLNKLRPSVIIESNDEDDDKGTVQSDAVVIETNDTRSTVIRCGKKISQNSNRCCCDETVERNPSSRQRENRMVVCDERNEGETVKVDEQIDSTTGEGTFWGFSRVFCVCLCLC